MTITRENLLEQFKNKEITGFKANGNTYRLFISSNDVLCFYAKNKSRRGFQLQEFHLNDFEKVIVKKERNEDNLVYNQVAKFRREAMLSTFENDFIRQCRNLPKTREEWRIDGHKGPYQYGLTVGCSIDGIVISLDAIAKVDKWAVNSFKHHLANNLTYRTTFKFRGYDATMSLEFSGGIELHGYLALEYTGRGNGYYYKLINNNKFIGYEVD